MSATTYAVQGDVEREMGFQVDNVSHPSSANIKGFLDRHARTIQYWLSQANVSLPLDSDSEAYALMRDLNAIMAAIDGLELTTRDDASEQTRIRERIESLKEQIKQANDALRNDTFNYLQDADSALTDLDQPSDAPVAMVSSIDILPAPLRKMYDTDYVNKGTDPQYPGDLASKYREVDL